MTHSISSRNLSAQTPTCLRAGAQTGSAIDAVSLAQTSSSVFGSVSERSSVIRASAAGPDRPAREPAPVPGSPQAAEEFVDAAKSILSQACSIDTTAIELTGGVDSRLLLALCASADARPAFAFTIGPESSDDALVARALCDIVGVEHRCIPTFAPERHATSDARAFCAGSGWICNAASSAWLPGVFGILQNARGAQITGVGGEIAGGFYHTPLDPLFGAALIGLTAPAGAARQPGRADLPTLNASRAGAV